MSPATEGKDDSDQVPVASAGTIPFGEVKGSLRLPRSLREIVEIARTPEGLKLVRYTAVSAISALTSLVLLTLIYGVFRLWDALASVLVANVLAGIPSYLLNRQWVWQKGGRSHLWREVLPFWVVSLTGIGFSLFAASVARDVANAHHLAHFPRTVLVVGANVSAFAIVWVLKFLILNRVFAQIADLELGPESATET
jgi:putative flippase GtrA